jgi:hypothetical protein
VVTGACEDEYEYVVRCHDDPDRVYANYDDAVDNCRFHKGEIVSSRLKGPARARLDADGTAKPKTEIVGVYPEGKTNWYHNTQELIARPTAPPSVVDALTAESEGLGMYAASVEAADNSHGQLPTKPSSGSWIEDLECLKRLGARAVDITTAHGSVFEARVQAVRACSEWLNGNGHRAAADALIWSSDVVEAIEDESEEWEILARSSDSEGTER